MTRIQKSALVPYSNVEMFQLVSQIETYPDFLPWCKEAKILSRQGTDVVASITMGGKGLEKSFTTNNTLLEHRSIEMRLREGPFSHLHGLWEFQSLAGKGCRVSLDMEFEISNPLLRVSLKPVFTKIVNSLVDAFVKRANELYGKSKSF